MIDARLVEKTGSSTAAAWQGVAGQLQALAEGAGSYYGQGMNELAATSYGCLDWLLVRVSLHEAAHAVVAEEFDLSTRIEIDSGNRIGNGRCWIGPELLKASSQVRMLIGLAGSTAEQIAAYGVRHAGVPRVHQYLTWPRMMSQPDQNLARGFTVDDTAKCHALVIRKWPAIAATARRVLHEQLQVNGQRGLQ